MKRPKNYSTKQSEAIFEYIASLGEQHVTANQITAHFESEDFPYRDCNNLQAFGKVCPKRNRTQIQYRWCFRCLLSISFSGA